MIVLGLIFLSIENLANVFKGVLDNYIFCTILLLTSCLQALIVEFGSLAFKVAESGLSARFWALSLILGAGSLPVQQVINQLYRLGQKYNIERNTSRKNRDRKLATLRVPGVATNT
jgi:Ca2+ transporting ATPase